MLLSMMKRLALACLFLNPYSHALTRVQAIEPAKGKPEPGVPEFERDVRPILKAYCWHCHGEEPELGGGLDARLVRTLSKGGENGPALVPGHASDSLLVQRILSEEMPPGEKKLNLAQRQTIQAWIDAGARHSRPEPESLPVGEILTDDDRGHWSFQPIGRPTLPEVKSPEDCRTAIDHFLLARLEVRNEGFNPEADRLTLVRRLSFDLTGLPPTPELIDQCMADDSEQWYERIVDRLLASPAFGERWGRHWLDVVGYADSNGYTEKDSPRQWVWKYRDYVIDALNDDMPWNRFVVEQIAGDELVKDLSHLEPADVRRLVATAYLRLVPDGTGESGVNANEARNDTIAETVKVLSSSLLGLTVGCAQCHSHRFDPITHVDYYRVRAILAPALNMQEWKRPQERLISLWSEETRQFAGLVDAEQACLKEEREAALDELVASTFERELPKLPEEIRAAAREARQTAVKERSTEQKELIKQYPFLNVDRGSVYLYLPDRQRGFNKKWDDLQAASQARRPAEDYVFAVTEPGQAAPPTHLYSRGDYNQPRQVVEPGELEVLRRPGSNTLFVSATARATDNQPVEVAVGDPSARDSLSSAGNGSAESLAGSMRTSGRRLAYARYLTSGDHPLVSRVLTNRFWMHLFGKGLVATTGDFGLQGDRPSHPELLDWLAGDFTDNGWEIKRWIRQVVLSRAYRQSSQRRESLWSIDPDNRLLGRMPLRRIESEVMRDAVLFTSGQLSSKRYGTPVPVAPDETGQFIIANDNRDSAGRPQGKQTDLGEEAVRRTIYVQVRRTMPLSILEPFDHPVMAPNCEQRATSTVPTQSLVLMNSEFVAAAAGSLVKAMEREVGSDTEARLQWIFRRIMLRQPTDDELRGARAIVVFAPGELPEVESAAKDEVLSRWTALCHALLCSTRYVMVE